MNCFYYVGALNETVGYSNRIARFLDKASQSKDSCQVDALLLTSEPTGRSALAKRSVRSWSSPAEQPSQRQQLASLVAVFSHVTVKNPANITLIQDLNMQVPAHSAPARAVLITRRLILSIVVLRYPVGKAASYPGLRAAANRPFYASSAACGQPPPAASGYRSTSAPTACSSFRSVSVCLFRAKPVTRTRV